MNNEITAKIEAAAIAAQELAKAIKELHSAACYAGGDNESTEAVLLAELVQREISPSVQILGNLSFIDDLYCR